jgi:2-methylisocitrate lyase-like PEP mutase family enzyme
LSSVERLAEAKVKAMSYSEAELRWATKAVEKMLVRIARALAGEYEAAAIRLRRWVR